MTQGYVQENAPAGTVFLVRPDDDYTAKVRRALAGSCRLLVVDSLESAKPSFQGASPQLALLDATGPSRAWYGECMAWKRALGGRRGAVLLAVPDVTVQIRLLAAMAKVHVLQQSASVDELAARVSLEFQLLAAKAELHEAKTQLDEASRRTASVQLPQAAPSMPGVPFPDESAQASQQKHRIQAYTRALASQLREQGDYLAQIDDDFLEDLWLACHLHDLGKVAVSDSILQKPGALAAEEREHINLHAEIGANLLEHAYRLAPANRYLIAAAAIARFHHERWDGAGYPAGLCGVEIPLAARIVALADAFDAITSDRPHRPARSSDEAREVIELESARQFDPAIVQAFVRRFDEFVAIRGRDPLDRGPLDRGIAGD